MTAGFTENDKPQFVQRNEGSGVFVGRDMYGDIVHPIDETTKKILEQLRKDAPDLARVLRKAIEQGIVSPDVAHALRAAAQSINEDTANLLYQASQGINEDVAHLLLTASDQIATATSSGTNNLGTLVARMENLASKAETISQSLYSANNSYDGEALLNRLDTTLANMHYQADRMEGVVAPLPAQIIVNWKPTFWAFLWGLVAGLAFMAWAMTRQ